MTHQRNNICLAELVLERCDELEEAAIKMAREISHLRSAITMALNEESSSSKDHNLNIDGHANELKDYYKDGREDRG